MLYHEKALGRGVTHTAFDTEEIIDGADRKLFTRITISLQAPLINLDQRM